MVAVVVIEYADANKDSVVKIETPGQYFITAIGLSPERYHTEHEIEAIGVLTDAIWVSRDTAIDWLTLTPLPTYCCL